MSPHPILLLTSGLLLLALSGLLVLLIHRQRKVPPGATGHPVTPEPRHETGNGERGRVIRQLLEGLSTDLAQADASPSALGTIRRLELLTSSAPSTARPCDPMTIIDHALIAASTLAPGSPGRFTCRIDDDLPDTLRLNAASLFDRVLDSLMSDLPPDTPVTLEIGFDEDLLTVTVSAASMAPQKIRLPASEDTGPAEKRQDITLLVLLNDSGKRSEVIRRLNRLGAVAITDPGRSADGCVISSPQCETYQANRQKLSPDMPLVVLDPPQSDTAQGTLACPLTQEALIPVLAQIAEKQASGGNRHSLLVDDNPTSLRLLGRQLSEQGISFDTASSGEEALSLVKRRDYGHVFMDIQMPGMNGVEATRQIHRINPRTHVIGLTAHATPEEKQAYRQAGMNDVVIKPVRLETLKHLLTVGSPAVRPQAATRRNHLPVFDLELALENAGQRPEVARELFELLIESLPADLQAINASRDDPSTMQRAVHRLNGAVRYCGVPRLANAIARLETALKREPELVTPTLNLLNGETTALLSWAQENDDFFMTHRESEPRSRPARN